MIIPNKLKSGDEIRVIAPSRSLSIIGEDTIRTAQERFESMGLKVSFGRHVKECEDDSKSSPIESRISDLHDAFSDSQVKAVFTIIGGFNCNQLLKYIDYDLIRKNPKIFCGFSDITALQNAIHAKTGLVTYSGPHFSTFGMVKGIEYTQQQLKKCLFEEVSFEIPPSREWSDDAWFMEQEKRTFISNPGYNVINEGSAEGHIVGGNLCTLNLLQGTKFMPKLDGAILFLEDDDLLEGFTFVEVDRNLQSLIHLPDFENVRGLVFGRFQKGSKMDDKAISRIIETKKELLSIPVISGLDFGHTTPHMTFPVGGRAKISASSAGAKIEILEH